MRSLLNGCKVHSDNQKCKTTTGNRRLSGGFLSDISWVKFNSFSTTDNNNTDQTLQMYSGGYHYENTPMQYTAIFPQP